jgi:hypothetical protein
MKSNFILYIFLISLLITGCGENEANQPNDLDTKMNRIAESYVKLILNIGLYDPDYVDAYYGPEDWRPARDTVSSDSVILSNLYTETDVLLDSLDALSDYKVDELQRLRFRYLYKQILSAKGRIFMLAEGSFTFDEEAEVLYDAQVPVYSEEFFQTTINELDKIVPGEGDIQKRMEDYKNQFIIPEDKLDEVFTLAINECRKRTLNYIQLPAGENFQVEYVTGKPWAAYNWYKGNSFSLIQVNTGLPIYIERAVDLAAHEGYPGHHVYNVLLERNMVKKNNWVEFTVYALFSPQSLIAEGTANYGINMAFPGSSKIEFEKEVLFPAAGLDASKADEYYKIFELSSKLGYAVTETARNYLNGEWTREESINWLAKFGLRTKERAEQNIRFIEKYRSYIINYYLGKDIVKEFIERNGGTPENSKLRWQLFERLISTPQTPSGLVEKK